MAAKADYSAQRKWVANNLKVVSFRIYKGRDEELRAYAEERGLSLNKLIVNALEAYTGIPVGKKIETHTDE